ncbi:CTLH/CRA C-terminal to lish motif domain-domain-containing protein [Absidia repens]|uniref:CTLH/CRA C-terminal to lish motif domain-domain-containing protein n=1 Tax=Absidia repens TaxID=90262 RepID=A0A1X2IR92_9FUNG|nr:CTLH/CRA C-terminal to lish motif domain-domain-containing protein [Absidia repens]
MEPPIDDMCHDIIMEYLMHSCYKNTAKAFDKEFKKQSQYCTISVATPPPTLSQDAMDIDQDENGTIDGNVLGKDEKAWALLDARKDLYDAIERGDIPQAFDLIQKRFPGLIQGSVFSEDYDSSNGTTTNNKNNSMTDIDDMNDYEKDEETARTSRVLFKLRCQQFIEIVRSATEVEAIRYAQQYLRPMHKEYHAMITEVASLIAYADPEQSNQAHLLSQDRRRQLADEVNCIVLAYCKMPEQTAMEKLHKQHQVVQQELDTLKKMDEKSCSREKLAI